MYNERDFKQGLLAGVLLSLTLTVLVVLLVSATNNNNNSPYLNAYLEGKTTVPYMQEQDSIDTAVSNLQTKYELNDEQTESLYQALVD